MVLVVGVFVIGLFLVLVIYRIFVKGSVNPSDIVDSTLSDLKDYVVSFSTIDSGVKYYYMPYKFEIKIEENIIQVSYKDYKNSVEVPDNLIANEIESDRICIVKNKVGGAGKILICDSSDSTCCSPKII